jgi:hypothetical protein
MVYATLPGALDILALSLKTLPSFTPADSAVCICRDTNANSGTIGGNRFNPAVCAPYPVSQLITTHNAICNISEYNGGRYIYYQYQYHQCQYHQYQHHQYQHYQYYPSCSFTLYHALSLSFTLSISLFRSLSPSLTLSLSLSPTHSLPPHLQVCSVAMVGPSSSMQTR